MSLSAHRCISAPMHTYTIRVTVTHTHHPHTDSWFSTNVLGHHPWEESCKASYLLHIQHDFLFDSLYAYVPTHPPHTHNISIIVDFKHGYISRVGFIPGFRTADHFYTAHSAEITLCLIAKRLVLVYRMVPKYITGTIEIYRQSHLVKQACGFLMQVMLTSLSFTSTLKLSA